MTSLQTAIDRFLADFAIGRQSHQTIETYAQGLKRLTEFMDDWHPGTPAEHLSVGHALECAKWLSERRPKIAKATLNLYLSCVARFYRYLLRERMITLDASDLERMRTAYHDYRSGTQRPLPKLPPDEVITALVTAARRIPPVPGNKAAQRRTELARLRNIAIVESLRSSGMRVGELVALKRGDVNYRDRSAKVTGKGGKQRIVYFDEVAWQALQEYLKYRKDGTGSRLLETLPLFAQHGKRASKRLLHLTTDHVRFVFRELAEDGDIPFHLTPHSMRHAFATRMLDTSNDLALVQDALGHASPVTTRIYAKVSDKRIRLAHEKAYGDGHAHAE